MYWVRTNAPKMWRNTETRYVRQAYPSDAATTRTVDRCLALQRRRHAVTDGEQGKVDALILGELGVERADRLSVGGLVVAIDHRATPQHVVDQDQAARPQQGEAALVVGVVIIL